MIQRKEKVSVQTRRWIGHKVGYKCDKLPAGSNIVSTL